MKKNNSLDLPSLSIVIITLNVEKKLAHALKSIEQQKYPKDRMEVLIIDGGSTDGTLQLAKQSKLPIRIIDGGYPDNQEARRGVGLLHATGAIVAYIDADNYLPHPLWLQKMVQPFLAYPDIVGTYTLRYAYRKNDTALNRYFSLLGSGDPVDYYLKKGERLSFLYDSWNKYGTILSLHKDYFVIKFNVDKFPTLGANGFLVRRSIWRKAIENPSQYVHVDVPFDLAKKKYQLYAVVNDGIIHDTATTLTQFLKKRVSYILFYQHKVKNRSYKVFDYKNKEDLLHLFLFLFCALTFIEPLIFSIRGFLKKRDSAWFIHPVYCFTVAIIYPLAFATHIFLDRMRVVKD